MIFWYLQRTTKTHRARVHPQFSIDGYGMSSMQIGVTFNFSKYVGLDPASTLYPQKYQEYQAYPKNI